MKKYIYSLLLGTAFLTGSCSDFTEIQPKGMNLLTTTEQLEMLLNNPTAPYDTDLLTMSGDFICTFENIPTLVNAPNKNRNAIMVSWDESQIKRMKELTLTDGNYETCYEIIGRIANPILNRIDAIEGDEATKTMLKCEALVLRAYYHYILVNKFAKAYNPTTAEKDLGIPYVMENIDITQPTKPLTVKQVYDNILEDLDKAIELDGLPVTAISRMRISKPCAYAAKALVLLSMQEFDRAMEVANQALALNNTVNNYNEMTEIETSVESGNTYPVILRTRLKCEEDLFYTQGSLLGCAISPEAWNAFEEGHACHDKIRNDLMLNDYDPMLGVGYRTLGLSDYISITDGESGWNYAGIKTTHMYLIVAEAEINKGNYDEAMKALDVIRQHRIAPAIYEPLEGTVTTKEDAIFHLKQTSHGENVYSCYNFINYKRWNQVEGYKKSLSRNLGGQVFTLSPESPLWVFPIPQNVLNVNPNFGQ